MNPAPGARRTRTRRPPDAGSGAWDRAPSTTGPDPMVMLRQVRPTTRLPAPGVDRTAQVALSGFSAEMAPDDEMHTAPVAFPGTFRLSPVSAVTVAVNLSAVGLLDPPLT